MADDYVEVEGKISTVLPGTMFRVELTNGHQVLAHISGKLRKNFIRLTAGDIVKMEMSPKDLSKARIIYRLRYPGERRGGEAPAAPATPGAPGAPAAAPARPAPSRPSGGSRGGYRGGRR